MHPKQEIKNILKQLTGEDAELKDSHVADFVNEIENLI